MEAIVAIVFKAGILETIGGEMHVSIVGRLVIISGSVSFVSKKKVLAALPSRVTITKGMKDVKTIINGAMVVRVVSISKEVNTNREVRTTRTFIIRMVAMDRTMTETILQERQT